MANNSFFVKRLLSYYLSLIVIENILAKLVCKLFKDAEMLLAVSEIRTLKFRVDKKLATVIIGMAMFSTYLIIR